MWDPPKNSSPVMKTDQCCKSRRKQSLSNQGTVAVVEECSIWMGSTIENPFPGALSIEGPLREISPLTWELGHISSIGWSM